MRPSASPIAARNASRFGLSLLGLLSLAASAQVVPQNQYALMDSVIAPTGYVATVSPVPLIDVQSEMDPATLQQIANFKLEAGQNWSFYVDRRSGGMALVEGQGQPWIPGSGNSLDPTLVRGSGPQGTFTATDLEIKARAFINRYPNLFQVPDRQLFLDSRGTLNFGESGQFWSVVFQQHAGGVPVDNARVIFRLSHGNLVQFGVDRIIPRMSDTKPPVVNYTAVQAKNLLATYIGGLLPGDVFSENGTLLWIGHGTADEVGYTGPIGSGWEPQLVYRFTFSRPGQGSDWQALVDARSGAVLRFIDATAYASLAKASVYTLTNCSDPNNNCVTGDTNEVAITMPFAKLTFTGGPACSGDTCYTNSAGAFTYPAGAASATTTLDGKYIKIVDTCGSVAASAPGPSGNIDLGTSDPPTPPLNTNTDCFAATRESPPNSGPVTGGSGDTHSARNCFYHLNLINQKARFYLPNNEWLKGVDGFGGTGSAVLTTTNLAPACNAFWSGGTGSLNFERKTPAPPFFCNNTGEIPDVFLHEFGHGLDQNDGTGTAPESATGEAMGDTFALLEGQHSCIGVGFRLQHPTDLVWGNKAGYGSNTTGSGAQTCSGVRDSDFTRFCSYNATDCLTQTAAEAREAEPPTVIRQGSNSGLNPPLLNNDIGTPAKWSTMIAGAAAYVPVAGDGKINFYNCRGPETTGCKGPLNHGCHCESTIASQANFDLVKQLIRTEYGGSVYANPQAAREVSGWQYTDRLWYLTRDIAVSAYSVNGLPTAPTNGCGVSNWFSTYRLVDDNDGNLANGTPHAADLFNAFNLHEIACGAAGDPANQRFGCPAPIAAPALTACDAKAPVQISWTASPGATKYRVLRNTLGCGFGFKPLAIVNSPQLFFEDSDVAPGSPYYYTVQPVGANASCYGQTSNCITVIPTVCTTTFVTPPSGVTLTTPAANQINVAWNAVAGAGSYKISRKTGNCTAPTPYTAIGTVTSPTTSFLDAIGLQGTQTYAYQVVATDNSCASCASPPSVCVSIVATGACGSSPAFAGVQTVSNGTTASCAITLNWNAGVASCGSGALTYNVYRSTLANFIPSAANRIASGVSGTSYTNSFGVAYNTAYYYVVRAVDSLGNEDGNTVNLSGMATGPRTGSGTFSETFEAPGGGPVNSGWVVNVIKAGAVNPWRTSNANPNPPSPPSAYSIFDPDSTANSDHAYESPLLSVGAGSVLTFWHTSSFENQADTATCGTGFDGGIVEYRVCTATPCVAAWTALLAAQITGKTYNGSIASTDNNLNGSPGFVCGTGALPAYAQSTVNIGAITGAGTIQVRWRQADDTGNTGLAPVGWYVDDVQVTNVGNLQTSCTTAACPVVPMSTLTHGKSGSNLVESWPGVAGAATYNVYRGTSTNPTTFTSPLASLFGSRPGYTDVGQIGNATSQYYSVTYINECLAESPK